MNKYDTKSLKFYIFLMAFCAIAYPIRAIQFALQGGWLEVTSYSVLTLFAVWFGRACYRALKRQKADTELVTFTVNEFNQLERKKSDTK